ncbi:MAG: haloacid dehalogenase-like hydrolase [Verrucomicrobiota bacterium]|nr:haloacid dehalogenase-like hydrolase [Verrucomicrobiota bacterium]
MNVFDFDNTIYNGESGLDLFGYYVKRYPGLLRHGPRVLAALVRYKLGCFTLDEALNRYAYIVEAFTVRILDTVEADMVAFWDGHIHKIKPLYDALRSPDDLILSASPEIGLAEVCRRLGVRRYIGTRFDPATGRLTHLNFRENKVRAFLAQYPDGKIDKLYTDSLHDQPLFALAGEVHRVKGNKITRIQ